MMAVLFSFRTLRVRTLPQEVVIELTSAKLAEAGRFQSITLTPQTAGTEKELRSLKESFINANP